MIETVFMIGTDCLAGRWNDRSALDFLGARLGSEAYDSPTNDEVGEDHA